MSIAELRRRLRLALRVFREGVDYGALDLRLRKCGIPEYSFVVNMPLRAFLRVQEINDGVFLETSDANYWLYVRAPIGSLPPSMVL